MGNSGTDKMVNPASGAGGVEEVMSWSPQCC